MNFTRSLQWRIAAAYTALIFVTMGVVSIYLIDFVSDRFYENLQNRLVSEATVIGRSVTAFVPGPELRGATEAFGDSVGGHVTVVDADGMIVADSEGSAIGQATEPEFAEALLGRVVGATRNVPAFGGEELRYAAVPIEMNGEIAGIVRVGVPTSSVSASIDRLIATVSVAAALVAALSIALGWYVARRTTRSVLAVTSGARQLAAGNLDHRVPALGTDESREMAIAFNRMARTIRSTVTALESERSKLSAVLDTMDDGVIVADSNGDVTLVNHSAQAMLGLGDRDAVGERLAGVVWDHEVMRLVTEAIRTGEPSYGEVALTASHRTVSAVATPVRHEGAEGVLITLHDLTRRRLIDVTRREFVSNVSHELRSPLASMKAMVETLQLGAKNDAEKADDFLARIDGEVDRMTALVSELLELSRLESGHPEIAVEPFELGPVVAEVVERLSDLADSEGITVVTSLPGNLPTLAGDRGKISQVLINLVDNSLTFAPETGEVTISAEGADGSAPDGFVRITVADNGAGIAPEHLPHLFERFYKVDRSRRGRGTGLGLAIVKHIVQAHGGEVGVDSDLGRGARFTFTVPVAQNE